MAIKKDGKTWDTLENFHWPKLVGGPGDGQEVGEPQFKQKEIVVEGEIYLRHRFVTGRARIIYFIAEDWPKAHFESYEVGLRILASHPDLRKVS